MSILSQDDLLDLRTSDGIVPDSEDSTVEIWERAASYVDGQTSGGYGVDALGAPVTTGATPGTTPGYTLTKTLFGRVSELSGREVVFGDQNTAIASWAIVLPAIDQTTFELIRVKKGDQLRVLQPDDSYLSYEVVTSDQGSTYGVLLTVKCQLLEVS